MFGPGVSTSTNETASTPTKAEALITGSYSHAAADEHSTLRPLLPLVPLEYRHPGLVETWLGLLKACLACLAVSLGARRSGVTAELQHPDRTALLTPA